MKHRKKYLLFTMLALGLGVAGINNQYSKEYGTSITKAAESGFIIDTDGTLTKYNGTDTDIVIPDGVTRIGDSAFSGCHSLNSITMPDSLKTIGHWSFIECRSLTSITIPDNVEIIGDMAFSGCKKLSVITIPDKTTKLGDKVFDNCPALKEIKVKSGNKKYITKDGALFKKKKSSLVLMVYPAQKKGNSYKLPAKTDGIENGAFSGCKKLKELVIPGNIKNINYSQGSFWGFTNLKNLKITMKKGEKINVLFNLNIYNEDDGIMPEITARNKNTADIKLPVKDNYFKDDDTDHALVKGTIKAKKKGKAKIIFQRTISQMKQTSSTEYKPDNIKLKTTLDITVK